MTKGNRRSIRLRGWDYRQGGMYFLTICTYQRQCLFENGDYCAIAENGWRNIPSHPHARHVVLDEWVVMPNHVHGLVGLVAVEGVLDVPLPDLNAAAGSVGVVVSRYKALVTRRINQLRGTPRQKVWQRGYYDRIVRNERELNAIRQYIRDNPRRWAEDRENLDGLLAKMGHQSP